MDFQLDLGKSEFATDFVDKILSSDGKLPLYLTAQTPFILRNGQSSR